MSDPHDPTDAVTLRPAGDADLSRLEALLESNGLPTDDIREAPGTFFLASAGGTLVGAGGVEVHGDDGLLRSVVVVESARGREHGTALCDALATRARADGVTTLYLLTTAAAGFFDERGYETIPRAEAPPAIRGTAEFAALCPDDATCMWRRLG